MEKFQFTILWPVLHLWNAKTGNLKKVIGSFLGNKKNYTIVGDVSSIISQGLSDNAASL